MIWLLGAALASVTLAPEPATAEAPTVLTVLDDDGRPRSGETVRVLHRPGLVGEAEQAIGITDARGQVRWTPSRGGVAHLRAGDAVHAVHVQPATPRLDVPLLLGLLLLGGLGATGYGLGRRR